MGIPRWAKILSLIGKYGILETMYWSNYRWNYAIEYGYPCDPDLTKTDFGFEF